MLATAGASVPVVSYHLKFHYLKSQGFDRLMRGRKCNRACGALVCPIS